MNVTRRLTFCAGHRVLGHEGKCAHPHGHNYVAEITVDGTRDRVGRVVDFGVLKQVVGSWIDEHWDHAFLICDLDAELVEWFDAHPQWRAFQLPVNPTAENLAELLLCVSQNLLHSKGLAVWRVRLWETENCYADAVPD